MAQNPFHSKQRANFTEAKMWDAGPAQMCYNQVHNNCFLVSAVISLPITALHVHHSCDMRRGGDAELCLRGQTQTRVLSNGTLLFTRLGFDIAVRGWR